MNYIVCITEKKKKTIQKLQHPSHPNLPTTYARYYYSTPDISIGYHHMLAAAAAELLSQSRGHQEAVGAMLGPVAQN